MSLPTPPFRLVISLATSLLLLSLLGANLRAQNSSWDDAGGSASKLWSDFGNWSPDGSPSGRNIFVGNLLGAVGDTTLFDDNAIDILSLNVSGGASVVNSTDGGATNDFKIDVSGNTTVGGAGSSIRIIGADTDFIFDFARGLDTDTLTINNGGQVILDSTTLQGTAVVEVDNGLLDINAGGELIGTGRVELDDIVGVPTVLLRNDGEITANTTPTIFGFAPAAGTLRIQAVNANALFDWDGAGSGVLNVNGNQTLDIDVDTGVDAFDGTMNLFTGSTLDMADSWALSSGTINVNTAAFGLIIIGQDPNPGEEATITGASWSMSGGEINIEDSWDSLRLASALTATGGTINNAGTMIFDENATIGAGVDFNMTGAGAALEINAVVNIDTPNFNLDGDAFPGNVTTINSGGILDLDLGAGADENFHHTINLNGGELDVTTLDNDWSLPLGGVINAAGGEVSRIEGETMVISGDINVTDNSTLNIAASSEYSSTVDVVIEAGSVLNHVTTSYDGGNYTGGGVFRKGTATILSDTTWSVATVDIDDGSTTINNGANLVVETDSIDQSGDGIDGLITIADTATLMLGLNDGSDVVFEGLGRIEYNGNIISSNFLLAPASGSALRFAAGSELNVNGDGGSTARIKLDGGTLNINDVGEDFRMQGGSQIAGNTNEINGGTIDGPGELQIASGRALVGNGTINTQIDGDSSAQLLAEGGTLQLNGAIQDIGTLSTVGGAAVLEVTTPWNTNVTDEVVLNRGRIQGSTITNDGANGIVGHGVIASPIINNTLIEATGALIVENNANDWDGAADTGVLRSNNGMLELRDNAAFLFDGTVEANSGEVFANGFELEFDPASMLRLSKGAYRSNVATDFGGSVEVVAGAPSIIQVTATSVFENTSSTTLNDTLRLEDGQTRIDVGASFAGGGTLLIAPSHTLRLADGANVGVLVENQGRLELGASPGQATVLDYQQASTGVLEIELESTALNDFDRLTAVGLAQLDGELELSLLGGFNPALNDSFTILSAAAGVNGAFSMFDFSAAALDPGLVWDVVYNPTNVQLVVAEAPSILAGDYNDDGVVDAIDYAVWRENLGALLLPNDETPGLVDSDDYDVWVANFGAMAPGAIQALGAASVPEPSSALLLFVVGCALGFRRRK